MNKTTVAVVGLICVAALIGVWVYSNSFRYVTANAGDGEIYRIDRKTGETVLLIDGIVVSVEAPTPTPVETTVEKAFRLAMEARTLSDYETNKQWVARRMEEKKGDIKIAGWSIQEFDSDTYLTTFCWETDSGSRCYALEVKPVYEIVRNIIGDPALEKKYGFGE